MKAKDKVTTLLTKFPELRDSDNKLIAFFWYKELKRKGMNPNQMSAMDFLQYFSDSKLTNSETIHRCRRKAQEQNKELRGKNYEVRKGPQQDKWRKDLGYNG
tara:strand:+ start:67 stop:372 length:306 start_codon:yes stop_codon:yes gene_type:complete